MLSACARREEARRFLALPQSTSYFWNKLKEVPNRHLQRWIRDRDANGGLPLADFLDMASLPDQQLDFPVVAEAIKHCWACASGMMSPARLCGSRPAS